MTSNSIPNSSSLFYPSVLIHHLTLTHHPHSLITSRIPFINRNIFYSLSVQAPTFRRYDHENLYILMGNRSAVGYAATQFIHVNVEQVYCERLI